MARFDAFHHSNFRKYFIGQTISAIGTWLQTFAVTWLVLDLTGRSDRLGFAVALQFLPLLLFGVPAGVLADRVDNRRLLMTTSALNGAIALAFGAVVSTGTTNIWAIYGLTFLSGLVLAVERPAMQALLYQLVGRDDLKSAVSINASVASGTRLIGPALGGLLVAFTGIATCFYANAISYVAVFVALASIRNLFPRPVGSRGASGSLRAAVQYVRHRSDVRRPLLVMVAVGLIVLNFQTTFPSMVRFGFDMGAGAVGMAMSVSAIGSIVGGLFAAGVKSDARHTLPYVLVGFGAALVAVAVAPNFAMFVVLSVPLGFASATFQAIDTVAVQQATEASMQGRVMALHQMAWFGTTPIGALLMGWIIQISSPRVPFVLGSITAFACAAALTRSARRHEEVPVSLAVE